MKPIKLKINTETESYPIIIGSNLVSKFSNLININSIKFEKSLLLVDKNIPKRMLSQIKRSLRNKKIFIKFLIANEKNKNQKNINIITEFLLKKNFSRQDCLISIGGGITGDIGGFAASIYKRGIQFINIPTTLLSQVDSSIGGKTGINTIYGKNLIGSFYQPKLVVSDINFLKSLPKREIICGYGEILKHSLILNKKFYIFLNKNFSKVLNLKSPYIEKAIYESCKIKKIVVQKDEKEKNLRKVLNFGHTFAHAYEASLGYSKKLNHGEAVLLGINTAIKFSNKNKCLNQKDYHSIINHFKNSKLPSNIKSLFNKNDAKKILSYMMKDKKNNSNQINLILLKKIGSPIISKKFKTNILKQFLEKELI
jgi:3-dehydroquinate synthase